MKPNKVEIDYNGALTFCFNTNIKGEDGQMIDAEVKSGKFAVVFDNGFDSPKLIKIEEDKNILWQMVVNEGEE